MPITIAIGSAQLTPSNGQWLNNLSNTHPSLIEAYAGIFAGRMTLLDLAIAIENHDITLDDFARENSEATLSFLRENWIVTYVSIRRGPHRSDLDKVSVDLVERNIQALGGIRESVSSGLYPKIAFCLDEAIAQFEALRTLCTEEPSSFSREILSGIPPIEIERP